MPVDDLVALERRLKRIEDERQIERLIASYGPFVDAGDAEAVAAMWAPEGTYDVEGLSMRSRDDVRAMVLSEQHQKLIGEGCCHFLGPAVVNVDGDSAVAVCESALLVHHGKRFAVFRVGVHYFALDRVESGWEIRTRVARALDGDPSARDLLAAGVSGRAR
jgi:SnoaL-like domain